ncbi:flagellar export chaperone FlgN [Cellulomonas fengjieae]|uniref:Flagellar export chaperone FlgN n=1 Tax=Cellulomonas fengjieae TaxID=2819978 RepID=A0ABS3SI05_9CELL|nr:flagellar export chaperone FlgN [Cellulomonas fengjieae]MBO3084949.1 flagellar export chaperone FlgN [Cellulomonas fengjieae]MBO3100696.1 flagellar export chaperone FlgN [Cellulomonas fengjieae]QVI66450.1 flagellar export chaperone FlgN [Cellulomonas fengjieae]
MALTRLSDVLWRERTLLDLLLFKLEEEQMILTSGRSRWLGHATREVESVLDEIRSAEIGRSAEADAVAAMLGLQPGASLAQLAEHAPAPWDELLRAHRDAFASLTTEIAQLADGNRELLAMSHRATQETLLSLQEVHTYDGSGQAASAAPTAQLVDRSL